MTLLKRGILAALVIVSAVVVVAAPAFATPRLTSSTGTRPDNGAVSPYITPIGNTTTSSLTVTGVNLTLAIGGTTITCPVSGSGEIGRTHTQVRLSRVDFGPPGIACTSNLGDPTVVTNQASAARPWFLHVTSYDSRTGSSTLTMNLIGRTDISFLGGICIITVRPQSIRFTFTNGNTSLVMSDRTIVNSGTGICPSGNFTATATLTIRMDTARDDIRVTATSAGA